MRPGSKTPADMRLTDRAGALFALKPDIVVDDDIVIDTKWKKLNPDDPRAGVNQAGRLPDAGLRASIRCPAARVAISVARAHGTARDLGELANRRNIDAFRYRDCRCRSSELSSGCASPDCPLVIRIQVTQPQTQR